MSASCDIKKIKAGDENEFRKLIDANMDNIYVTALRITADEDDARDVVQETFLKVWEKRKSINDNNCIRPYIRRIAVNKCYDLLRKRKSRYRINGIADTSFLAEVAGDSRADYNLNNNEAVSLLNALASGLSPRQRIVFTMVELEGLSHDEVAEITGMNKTSIKSNLSHARKKIEGVIKQYLT
ncbi:MAG: RNA polymerase sigma factor [Bacteroidales bacterium]|nr:RNA polymerase sigma factor [Bacteroidales bacterium]